MVHALLPSLSSLQVGNANRLSGNLLLFGQVLTPPRMASNGYTGYAAEASLDLPVILPLSQGLSLYTDMCQQA